MVSIYDIRIFIAFQNLKGKFITIKSVSVLGSFFLWNGEWEVEYTSSTVWPAITRKKVPLALAGEEEGAPVSWNVNQKVTGAVPGQGTHLDC